MGAYVEFRDERVAFLKESTARQTKCILSHARRDSRNLQCLAYSKSAMYAPELKGMRLS